MATYQKANVAQSTPSTQSAQSGGLPIMNIPVVLLDGKLYPVLLTNTISGVLPVGKGGTGLSELDGGKLLASNEKGTSLEEIDVNVQVFKGLQGNIQDQLDLKARQFVLNVPTSGWAKSGNSYVQTFSLEGITSNDKPVVCLLSTATTASELKAEKLAYEHLDTVSAENNSITLTCFTSAPTKAFSISIICPGD